MRRTDLELRELIRILRAEFIRRDFDTVQNREIKGPLLDGEDPKKIHVLLGMRRSGKSFFQFQMIRNLLNSVPGEQIFYLNFEDDRVLPMSGKELGRMVDLFFTEFPENNTRTVFFFFDEIQNVDDWARTVRRIYDTKNCEIILTGSSAKLLSKEIDTSLRGRSLSQEIYPLSYKEWLVFRKSNIRQDLLSYLKTGGFPEVILMKNDQQSIETLQNYVHVTLLKDLIERHQISNETAIRYLVKLLLSNVGKLASVNKLLNDLKSQGLKLGKDSIHDYIAYLEDAYFIFSVPLYTDSIRKQQANPKKIYSIDNGLTQAFLFQKSENLGNLFENQIFIDLKRCGYAVHYYKTRSGYEIDFIAQRGMAKPKGFQVSLDPRSIDETKEKLAKSELFSELNIQAFDVNPISYTDFLQDIQ